MILRLRRDQAQLLGISLACLFIFGALGLGAYLLGRANTPHDRTGKPLVLTPSLVWTHDYQAQARQWVQTLRSLDTRAYHALQGQADGVQTRDGTKSGSDPIGLDLYTAASDADALLGDAQALADTISLADPPPALAALQETALATTSAYQDCAARVGGWIAQPNTALQADAARSLSLAHAYLAALEESPWLTNS